MKETQKKVTSKPADQKAVTNSHLKASDPNTANAEEDECSTFISNEIMFSVYFILCSCGATWRETTWRGTGTQWSQVLRRTTGSEETFEYSSDTTAPA